MSLPPLTLIPAGAGSGKTYTLQTRLAEWVREKRVAPEKIVAVTFTEAAAAELRERIRAELVRQGRLEDALRLGQAYISTIHAFGLRLLTEFALDAGCNPLPRLLSEDEEGILIRQALAATDRAGPVMSQLYRFGYRWDFNSGKSAEDGFRDRILEVIRRLRAIGSPESDGGMIRRVQDVIAETYGPTEDGEALLKQMRGAVRDLFEMFPEGVSGYARTSGVAAKLAGDHQLLLRADSSRDLESDWPLWQELRGLQHSTARNPLPEGYDEYAEAVERAADGLLRHPGPLEEAWLHAEALLGAGRNCLARFAVGKADRGLVDYTDMLALALEMLGRRPEVLAAVRQRIDCLVIDEFQDTNPLQFALLWSLKKAGIPTLIVGDLKQAIMGFQDADARLLEELQKKFASTVSPLRNNWRSHPRLMAWINAVGQGLFGGGYTCLQPKAEFPSALSPLEIVQFSDRSRNDRRAEHTASRLKELLDDPDCRVWDKAFNVSRRIRGGDMAVICPTNGRLIAYAEALRRLGIRTRLSRQDWFGSRIVQLAYHALAYVADPQDRHAGLYLAATELGEDSLEDALKALLDEVEKTPEILLRLQPAAADVEEKFPAEILAEVIGVLDLYGRVALWPDAEQARANLLRLESEAHGFAAANRDALAASGFHGSDLKTFLAWLVSRVDAEDEQPDPRVTDEDAVQLVTWHRSKGREWPVVAVCAADAEIRSELPALEVNYEDFGDLDAILDRARLDFYPKFAAPEKNRAFLDSLWPGEEAGARRLWYVALTRAREKVLLEWPAYLDNGNERAKVTFWELLVKETGMALAGNKLRVLGQEYDCRVLQVEKDRSPLFENTDSPPDADLPVLGRRALKPGPLPSGLTPETIRPSLLDTAMDKPAAFLETFAYAQALDWRPDLPANVRGTILHQRFEWIGKILNREKLSRAAAYEFTPEEFALIESQVKAFDSWMKGKLGATAVSTELPILTLDERGSVVTGTIDLLVETPEGLWIIDHKSDQCEDLEERFLRYLPQLRAYAEAFGKARSDKPLLGVGINWISSGVVMF
ncbi:MAG: UvrD-helicase domain-containing protein, partial [Desulfuromonadaceae bacterium]|nr:UvrD-helicase domain-containing protein [Desulfuromonadaceae bacterium]